MILPPADNLITRELARTYEDRRAAADRVPRSIRAILRRLDRLRAAMDRVDLP